MEKHGLTLAGFGLRFLFALLLVICSYNPSGYSYTHWLMHDFPSMTPLMGLAGIALIIGWIIFAKATVTALGQIGLVLLCGFLGCFIWLFISWGWFSLSDVSVMAWILIIAIAIILAIGVSWSHIHRRLTGQVDVDQVESDI